MQEITKNNIDKFKEYFNDFHDSTILSINYDIKSSTITIDMHVFWSNTPSKKDDGSVETNKTRIKLYFKGVEQCNNKELFEWDYINCAYLKYITFEEKEMICFANDEQNPDIYIVCEELKYEEVKTNELVLEVGLKLDKPLEYYQELLKKSNAINTYTCETHDLYWSDSDFKGMSEKEIKNACIRFRATKGVGGVDYHGNPKEPITKGYFQNYHIYNPDSEKTFEIPIEDLPKYNTELERHGWEKTFDTFKTDYQYKIGKMKSRIQLQDIRDIGLLLYYDNPDLYHLPLKEQREALIDELNSYGFDFKYDELGLDKLRTLYYRMEMFSENQND